MFMASYTANYGLHQWEAADDFLRTDFNADHLLIDTALAGKGDFSFGQYTGNGAETGVTLTLPFAPKAVVLQVAEANFFGPTEYLVLTAPHTACYMGHTNVTIHVEWLAGGLRFYPGEDVSPSTAMNSEGSIYSYWALG